jgi:hypothetical protein
MRLKTTIVTAAALLSLTAAAVAGEADATGAMKPLKAVSTDVGARHLVSFFVKGEGRCDLTVLTADRFDENAVAAPANVQRLRLQVDPNRSARLDAPGGASLEFACAPNATAMTLTRIDRLAMQAPAQ